MPDKTGVTVEQLPVGESQPTDYVHFRRPGDRDFHEYKQDFLSSAPILVDTIDGMQAIDRLKTGMACQVTTTGRAGLFRWQSGDLSAEVAADPLHGIYVPADGDDGSGGAWVRAEVDSLDVRWFGVVGDGEADDTEAATGAVVYSSVIGRPLRWERCVVRVTGQIAASVSRLMWHSHGAQIVLDSASDINELVRIIVSDDGHHFISGTGLTFNGNGKCHSGLKIINEGSSQTVDFEADAIIAKNVECQASIGEGSSGIVIRGAFRRVLLNAPQAYDVKLRTGAGTPGTKGVTGIKVMNHTSSGGTYPKFVKITDAVVDRVYSEDPSYNMDMDGIGVFANPFVDNTNGPSVCEIISPVISRCWGRDLKTQIAFTRVDSPESSITEGPDVGMSHPAYHIQSGVAVVNGGSFTISGVSRTPAAAVVSFSRGASRWSSGIVNIMPDASLANVAVCDQINNFGRTMAVFSGVTVYGECEYFASQYTNGDDIDAIKIENVICEALGTALVRVVASSGGTPPYRGRVIARNNVNLGAEVPTVHRNISGSAASCWLDDDAGIGFGPIDRVDVATSEFLTGIYLQTASVRGGGVNASGTSRAMSEVLPDGAEVEIDTSHGFSGVNIAEICFGQSRSTTAILSCDASGANVIYKGSSIEVGTTSDPGTGLYRIWSAGGGKLVFKNTTGATRYVNIKLFG